MTIVNQHGRKVKVYRPEHNRLWLTIMQDATNLSRQDWRCCAMFALKEIAGWPLDQISQVFGIHPGHVSRCVKRGQRLLQRRCRQLSIDPRKWTPDTNPATTGPKRRTSRPWPTTDPFVVPDTIAPVSSLPKTAPTSRSESSRNE